MYWSVCIAWVVWPLLGSWPPSAHLPLGNKVYILVTVLGRYSFIRKYRSSAYSISGYGHAFNIVGLHKDIDTQ